MALQRLEAQEHGPAGCPRSAHEGAGGVRLPPRHYVEVFRGQSLGPLQERGDLAVLARPGLIVVAIEVEHKPLVECLPEQAVDSTVSYGVDKVTGPTGEILAPE